MLIIATNAQHPIGQPWFIKVRQAPKKKNACLLSIPME
jgi:hypothetical protein